MGWGGGLSENYPENIIREMLLSYITVEGKPNQIFS